MLKMKLIGFILLQFIIGKRLQNLRKYDTNGNLRRFALDKITDVYVNKYEEPVKDKCVIKLVREMVNQLGNTYMIIEDDYVHEELLHNLQLNFVHSYFTEPSFLTPSNSESFYHLLILRKFKLREILQLRNPSQSTKFFILVKNYQQVIEKFEILWQHRLMQAVVSFVVDGNVYYYTYFPYRASHCGRVGTPHLLGKCNIFTGVFSHKEKLFPEKVKNLHKCLINVTFKENLPSSYYSKANELTGWEIDLVNEFIKRINGIPNYEILRLGEEVYSKQKGYGRLVENSEIGGGLAVSLKKLLKTDFCMYGMSVCMVWVVPKKGHPEYSFNFLFKVFSIQVWMLILITYFLMAFAIRLFNKSSLNNICFKLLPYLLGTTVRVIKIPKIFGTQWLWFCLIVNAVYQSVYQSRLLVSHTSQKSITTTEVVNSDLKIIGASDVLTDFIPYIRRRYNVSEKRFKNREWLSYENWVYRMTVRKDSAFFGSKEAIHYYIDKTKLATEIYVPDSCVINYLLTLVLKRNSHLTESIRQFTETFNENGFLDYFIRKHLSRESQRNIPDKLMAILKPKDGYKNNGLPAPVNMEKMFVIFMCFAAGILISLISFIIELLYKQGSKKISKKSKPKTSKKSKTSHSW